MEPELNPTDEWTTATPETYCIDYGTHHLNNAQYLAQIAANPPTILHVGGDSIFNNMFGTGVRSLEGAQHLSEPRQMSPPELEGRIREVRALLDAVHAAGVKTVMPYLSGMFFFGNQRKRTGLFAFFDAWDTYAEFGIGPRPADDPADWLGDREPRRRRDHKLSVYECCVNHPGWRQLYRAIASWSARSGYGALFSDVNSHHCYKPSCQAAFRRYLCKKYPPAELKGRFGFDRPGDVRMGEPGQGLLWVETQRHWGISFAELFAELAAAGQAHVRGFFVLPNSSSYANIDEVYKRRLAGHYIQHWARACPIFMFEKMEQPGRFGKTATSDSILQYKFAFANRTRAGMLLYNAQEPHSIALSNAEAAALGGGSFIQCGYQCPDVRTAYRAFFESNHDLLAGYSSHAQVAVVFFYDELFWDNPDHLEQVFVLKDYLCNNHVLWDFIVEKNFAPYQLAKYEVVIAPGAQHISDEQVGMLREHMRAGGGVVLIGEAGRFTDQGERRTRLPFVDALKGTAKNGVRSAKVGRGWVVHAAKIENLVRRPAFEIFQLTEDQANETATIIRMAKAAEASKQPHGRDRLLRLCEKMGKRKLSVAGNGVPFTLRVFAYKRRDADGRRMTVHLLNYDVRIREHTRRPGIPTVGDDPDATHRSDSPTPAVDIPLRIPLPEGWRPREVRLRGPHGVPVSATPFQVKDGYLCLTVPRVEVYEVLDVLAE